MTSENFSTGSQMKQHGSHTAAHTTAARISMLVEMTAVGGWDMRRAWERSEREIA